MSMMIAPYRFGGGGGGGLPDDVLAYASGPTSNVFDFQGLTLSGYERVIIFIDELTVNTNNTEVRLQFYMAGSLVTSGYAFMIAYDSSGTPPSGGSSSSAAAIRITEEIDTGSNIALSSVIEVNHPAASLNKIVQADSVFMMNTGQEVRSRGGGGLANTSAITGFRIEGSSGLITAGRVMVLALPTS